MKGKTTNLITLALAVAGAIITGILTIRHFQPKLDLGCSEDLSGCGGILGSSYSRFLGVPTAAFGLGMYAVLFLLCVLRFKRLGYQSAAQNALANLTAPEGEEENPNRRPLEAEVAAHTSKKKQIDMVVWGLLLSAFVTSWWLQYIALYRLGGFCPWCFTSACVVTLAFLVATYDFLLADRKLDGEQKMILGVSSALGVLMLVFYFPSVQQQFMQIKRGATKVTKGDNIKFDRKVLLPKGLHYKGDPKAPVVIVEFADLQCESCRDTVLPLRKMLEEFDGKVRLTYRHFPLDQRHKWAAEAAIATEAAGKLGAFWEMQEQIYDNQDRFLNPTFDPEEFKEFADNIQLNSARFREFCLDPATAQNVMRDKKAGEASGVSSTPTFFVINSKSIWRCHGFGELMEIIYDKKHAAWEPGPPPSPQEDSAPALSKQATPPADTKASEGAK